ncbi:MAG: GIY-YIG nuclease family protein [Kiritimatiellaeota bacterium]|nr:GIY-YIG nuclease family protein [Kiritimatiellota bacterium]
MFYFYILKSQRTGLLYKGHTQDIDARLKQHNAGKTRSTKNGIPWQLIYRESFATREEAIARERYCKSLEGGKELKFLLS